MSEKEYKRLRSYLNPTIRGPNTDALLTALSQGSAYLIDTVEAVNKQLYIVTASGKYLDQRMADRNLTRPDSVGLSDEVFRQIGIEVSNRKQVRDLIANLMNILYGDEFTRATLQSDKKENYQLEDGDDLLLEFDDSGSVIQIFFNESQFTNINNATAQEVADSISKEIKRLGKNGAAFAKDDGLGGYVVLISETIGPSSSIRVRGGKAQNKLQFPSIKPTTAGTTTRWDLTQVAGGSIRATWVDGPNPSIGKLRANDYVNIYGDAFLTENKGTFVITKVQGGIVNNAYFEFENPSGIPQNTLQGDIEGMMFFSPTRVTLLNQREYAALYQTESRTLEIFMPATTKVIRRERKGAAHIHESGSSEGDFGPYLFDPSKGYTISGEECNTTIDISNLTSNILQVDDSSDIPDNQGYLIFGYGTDKEEGPIPYIGRPSTNSLMLSPTYKFKNEHLSGTNISLVGQNYAYDVAKDGADYPCYLTDIVSGRLYAEELVNLVAATGMTVIISILYPSDYGLGKEGTVNSDKFYIWGE